MPERLTLPREHAIVIDGVRKCAFCGDAIDPIDWCSDCRSPGGCEVHRRPRRRSDAAFCTNLCRSEHRASFVRDCR